MDANLTYLPEYSTPSTLAFLDSSTGNTVTMTPKEANSAAFDGNVSGISAHPDSTAGASGASEGMSGAEGAAVGSAIMGACAAVASIASGIGGYLMGKSQMTFQTKMAKAQYTHQGEMAQIDMEMKKDQCSLKEQGIADKKESQVEYHAAREKRAKAEGQLASAKATLAEIKETKKAGKMNTSKLNAMFRGKYAYGSPHP